MATYSRDLFVRRVLVNLRAIDINESPEAEDSVAVDEITQQAFEGLYDDGLIPFDLDAEIPGRYFVPLRDIVSELAFPSYPFRDEASIGIRANTGRARLYALRNKPYIPTPVQVDYF